MSYSHVTQATSTLVVAAVPMLCEMEAELLLSICIHSVQRIQTYCTATTFQYAASLHWI